MNNSKLLDTDLPNGMPLYKIKNNKIWNMKTKNYVGVNPNNEGYGQVAYLNRHKKCVNITAHRLMYYLTKGDVPNDMVIDHKNGNKMDNRPSNLRLLSRNANGLLGKKPKGYKFNKSSEVHPYESKRGYNNKKYYLGSFGTPCGAYMQYSMFFINNSEVII